MKGHQKQFRFVEKEILVAYPLSIPFKQGEQQLSRIEKSIVSEAGRNVQQMITSFVNVNHPQTHVFATTTIFNISKLEKNQTRAVINLKRINDIRRINKFFEALNENIDKETLFIGCAETLELRKERLLKKFPRLINGLYVAGDFIFKRVIPKLPLTKQLYFALTGGRNRVISRAETLGRLYSCGFEVIHEETHGYLYYFVARKIKKPAFDLSPSYGPIFGMVRTGKDGKLLRVFKFRTMYPYSEYLQQYVYEKNKLDTGGKFKDDFRVTGFGRFMRRFWIDELPMLINFFKGELKLVGVRPLSTQFQTLYPKDLLETRHKFRPGLVPPYYADMPGSFEEILESEKRYLAAYERNKWLTDTRYFLRAFVNIVFRRARSK